MLFQFIRLLLRLGVAPSVILQACDGMSINAWSQAQIDELKSEVNADVTGMQGGAIATHRIDDEELEEVEVHKPQTTEAPDAVAHVKPSTIRPPSLPPSKKV